MAKRIWGILLAGVVMSASLLSGSEFLPFANRVAAGDVTETSAVLWARVDTEGTLTFLFIGVGDGAVPVTSWRWESVSVPDASIPAKVQIQGLLPGTTYLYFVIHWERNRHDIGFFRTPHPLGTQAGLRFGVSGDSRGELGPYPSITNATARGLDFFVNLGDTIYADVPSPDLPKSQATTLDEFRTKHQEVLSERGGLNAFGDLRSLTAFFAEIDDHEVTNDFAGGAHPSSDTRFDFVDETFINETALYEAGLQAFHDFNPIGEESYGDTGDPRTSGKRRLYRAQRFGSDAAVFLLDARSFRDQALPSVTNPFDVITLISFFLNTFDSSRTMLGAVQLEELKTDLLAAEQLGITWKFVMVPEPIQNLGPLLASDRFEGYASERTELLRFIHEERIRNVVFVAADLHGTLVNNLTYQTQLFGPQIPVDAFEIVNGPSAYDAPLGPTTVEAGFNTGLLSQELKDLYDGLPREGKDFFVQFFTDFQLDLFGYDTLGLQESTIDAQLIHGSYAVTHVYGWTEFVIDATTQALTVTVFGIEPYTEDDLLTNIDEVVNRVPEVVSQFVVVPK